MFLVETDFVTWLLDRIPADPRLEVPPGDDAAVLRPPAMRRTVVTVDMLTELGIPVFVLFCWWSLRVLRDGIWLLSRFGDDAVGRGTAALLLALYAYETLLVNKQGYLWAATLFFLVGILITRIRVREEALDAEAAIGQASEVGHAQDASEHDAADGSLAT